MAEDGLIRIYLESIASGGEAVGRHEGKTVFVEGGAPDETLICKITEEHKGWARAEILEITESSPFRIEPACPFYGKCGGCNLMHINYNAQIKAKVNIIKDSFRRIGGFASAEPEVYKSPEWGYRSRMQFHCLRERAKGMPFGLKEKKGARIIELRDCLAAEQGIRKLLQEGGKTIKLPPEKDRFTVFSKDPAFLNEGGIERGKISLLDKEIITDAGVFFQSNMPMLEELIRQLRKIISDADKSLPMADLYCGAGTFAAFLADAFPKIILAEENKKALSIARENLKGKKLEVFAMKDALWEKAFLRRKEKIGFVIADPPRAGLNRQLAEALSRAETPLLAYVSCDVSSLARDAGILIKGGYRLTQLNFFDFYPQTAHIESLALFEK